ncbi:MAG: MFS transporter [Candidatus Limnocylindrales bacterium]
MSQPTEPRAQSLWTRPFVGMLGLAMIGFGLEAILRAVVPLMVLARGGDAVMVGLVAGVYALPSILFRPLIGGLVDRWNHRAVLRLGALTGSIVPAFLLLPGIVSLFVVRFVHGTGWAFYSVANHALMAKLAPPRRRGEASGYYMAMPALATLLGPGLGVALFTTTGEVPVVVLTVVLGLVASFAAMRQTVPGPIARQRPAVHADAAPRSWWSQWLEPSAVPATMMVATFMSAHSLFIVFPPVYALAVGAPIELLAIYYPVYGLAMTASQLVVGRTSDRLGRATTIRIGCLIAIASLAIATIGQGLLTFVAASVGFGVAVSLVSPAVSALTIDRSPPDRIGAAMATYSVGYGLATGVSSVMWGALIVAFGFPWPFVVAIVLQLATIALSLRHAGPRWSPP